MEQKMNVKLSECPIRSNNLQFIRFVAAIMVIVSHSYSISTGKSEGEMLLRITNGQISMGGLAVSIFFCAGGFLIAKSICRVKSSFLYFKARVLRIFPSLVVVVFVSAFIIGPIMTNLSLGDYFKDIGVYKYLLNSVLILQHDLPGVFIHNPYGSTVNGSLWTLPVEFLCYIGVFIMWKMNFLKRQNCFFSIPIVLIGVFAIIVFVKGSGFTILLSVLRPGLLFYIGTLFYVLRESIYFTPKKMGICVLIVFFSSVFNVLNIGLICAFPYILLFLCFGVKQMPDKLAKFGDYSYGIYLSAFPIQQILVSLKGEMSPWLNSIISIPLAVMGGYLLYKYVEMPVIKRFG